MSVKSVFSIFKRKLSFKIGFFYLVTSIVTFSLLSFLIFTNEMQMLTQNAQYESNQLIYKVHRHFHPETPVDLEEQLNTLPQFIGDAILLDANGKPVYQLGAKQYPESELMTGVIKSKLFQSVENRPFYSTLNTPSSEIFYFLPLQDEQVLFIPIYLNQINSQLTSMVLMIGIALLLTVLIQIILAAMVNNQVIRPIVILKNLTQKVSNGHYVQFEGRDRSDEIGEIAVSFNKMSQTLKANHASLAAKYKQAKRQANTDPLTGAYNRRAMEDKLAHDIQFHLQNQTPLTLVILDIDFFKKVNDTYGHDAGDQCLIQFVKMIESEIKADDFLARFGGEEFALIFHDLDAQGSQKVVERIRQHIQSECIITPTVEFNVTASFGIVELSQFPDTPLESIPNTLFKAADQALYHAKENGRNQSVIFNA